MIEGSELSFGYRREQPVIDHLSFMFPAGAMTAITGRSGRGKSTLLYLIGLLLSPQAGELRVDGTAVSALPDPERSLLRGQRIGFVFQDAVLDGSRSVLDNVVEGTAFTGADRKAAKLRAASLLG